MALDLTGGGLGTDAVASQTRGEDILKVLTMRDNLLTRAAPIVRDPLETAESGGQ